MAKTEVATLNDRHGKLAAYLERDGIQKAIARALPKHMGAGRMIRVALTAAVKNPQILECTPESVYLSLLNAAQQGLEVNGRDGHLVPYKNKKKGILECQFIPDYKGLIKLAYQSGLVISCKAKAVYEKDYFEYREGTDEFLRFRPSDDEDRGELVYAWAMCHLKDGGAPFVVLNRADVLRHRKASQAAGSDYSPWNTSPEAMWAKTAFRELSKFIPLSPQLERAIEHETELEIGGNGAGAMVIGDLSGAEEITMEAEHAPATKSDQLAERLGAAKKPAATEEATEPAAETDDFEMATRAYYAKCRSDKEAQAAYDELCGPESTLREEELRIASRLYDEWKGAHKKKGKLFETQASATEAGM